MAIRIPKIKKKNSWQSKLARLALGLAALAIIAFLALSNWRIYNNRAEMGAKIEKLQEQIQILEERRETLKAGLNAASGESFQEEKMREQGYKKPGEEVIAVLRDNSTGATKQSEPVGGDNFWPDLWGKIKNIK
jgi:hypothetical protein